MGISELRRRMGESEWTKYQKIRAELKWRKHSSGENVTRWRQRVKMKLIQYKGGKCIVCGYDKNVPRAFVFHHRDPKQKDFTVGSGETRSLERLKKEVDKCDLMCSRCHAEKHDEEDSKSRVRLVDYEGTVAKLLRLRHDMLNKYNMPVCGAHTKCKNCNVEFVATRDGQTTCSKECRTSANRKCKNRPSKEELQELLDKFPWTKIGKMFFVTDNSVRKWARSYGLMAR